MRLRTSFPAPATTLWRAFFFIGLGLLLLGQGLLHAQGGSKRYRPQPDYVQLGEADQEEGRRLLAELRAMGIPGDYYLEFQLRMMPRRGEETLYTGRLWGGRREGGAMTRVELLSADGSETRLLILTGPAPAIWKWIPGQDAPQRLPTAELFTPLGNTLLTPFDFQMPYLFWNDFVFEGIAKVRNRPSYRFLFYPPADIAVCRPELTGVRVSMDTQFKALVESVQLGVQGAPLKLMNLLEFKKTSEQWIVRAIDVRDEQSRSKTRLSFNAAAMGLDFADVLFAPASLADSIRPPEGRKIDRF